MPHVSQGNSAVSQLNAASSDSRLKTDLALVFGVVLVLYLATLSRMLNASHDSAGYINAIDAGKLFHPHQLLFMCVSRLWIGLLRVFQPSMDSALAAASLNTVFGALTAAVVHLLLRKRLGLNRAVAFAGTAAVVFSYGVWLYSVCLEVDVAPLFFMLCTLYLITGDATGKSFALAGVTHGFGMLFHQAQVLFGPVVLLAAILKRRKAAQPVWRLLVLYVLAGTVVVAVPYLSVMLLYFKFRSPSDAYLWMTGYAHVQDYWYPVNLGTIKMIIVGLSRCYIGAQFTFAIPAMKAISGKETPYQMFMIRNMSIAAAWTYLLLSAAFVLLLAGSVLRRLRQIRAVCSRHRDLILLAAAWFVAYAVFFVMWAPWNPEFWLPQSVCLWILFMALWAEPKAATSAKPAILIGALAVILFIVNLFGGGIGLMRHRQNDYYYTSVRPLLDVMKPGDLMITACRHNTPGSYLEHFGGARVVGFFDLDVHDRPADEVMQQIRRMMDQTLTAGNKVFVVQDAVEPTEECLNLYGEGTKQIATLWADYRGGWEEVPAVTCVYVISP